MPLRAPKARLSVLGMLLSNYQRVSAMTYRTTFLASLSVVALVLAAGETFADPGPVRGAGVAPSRPAFPTRPVCINIITGTTGIFPRFRRRVLWSGGMTVRRWWRSSRRRKHRTTCVTPACRIFPGTTSIAVRSFRGKCFSRTSSMMRVAVRAARHNERQTLNRASPAAHRWRRPARRSGSPGGCSARQTSARRSATRSADPRQIRKAPTPPAGG